METRLPELLGYWSALGYLLYDVFCRCRGTSCVPKGEGGEAGRASYEGEFNKWCRREDVTGGYMTSF